MIDAVFISDLHLNPDEPDIEARFFQFVDWAAQHCKRLYILGDFFHAWAGDDSLDAWSSAIADKLLTLSKQGISVFFMPGNRDFLIGRHFAKKAGMTLIKEPYFLELGKERVLLVHGDRYCLNDKAHQRFRKLTRNRLFPWLFLKLPLAWRSKLVKQIRHRSQTNRSKSMDMMEVVPEAISRHLKEELVRVLIHGHTHRPGIYKINTNSTQIILSDWDDNPQLLCYDNTKGLHFVCFGSN